MVDKFDKKLFTHRCAQSSEQITLAGLIDWLIGCDKEIHGRANYAC